MRYFYCLCFVTCLVPNIASAAEWRDCEKAKLRQLDLQQSRRQGAPLKSGKKSSSSGARKSTSIEQLDEWLWKNCREYSYELRELEQQRM